MRKRPRVHKWAPYALAEIALLATLGCAATQKDAEFVVEEQEWEYKGASGKILKTPHFQIHTTLQDPLMLQVLPEFGEASYRRYEKLLPGGATDRGPMRSYVFQHRRQWNRFTREFANPRRIPVYLRIQSGGYTENDVAVLYHIGRVRTLSVFAHEGLHQYVASRFDHPVPAWLNEGLACYCEAFEMNGLEPIFTPTRNTFRTNHLRTALSRDELVPLEELLSTHAGNVIRLGGQKVATYYAQAWALAVFLLDGKNKTYTKGFRELLADAGTSRLRRAAQAFEATTGQKGVNPGTACFQRYVCEDLAVFNEEYVSFLTRLVGFAPGKAI